MSKRKRRPAEPVVDDAARARLDAIERRLREQGAQPTLGLRLPPNAAFAGGVDYRAAAVIDEIRRLQEDAVRKLENPEPRHCRAGVDLDGFGVICGAPVPREVCPFDSPAGCEAHALQLGGLVADQVTSAPSFAPGEHAGRDEKGEQHER